MNHNFLIPSKCTWKIYLLEEQGNIPTHNSWPAIMVSEGKFLPFMIIQQNKMQLEDILYLI